MKRFLMMTLSLLLLLTCASAGAESAPAATETPGAATLLYQGHVLDGTHVADAVIQNTDQAKRSLPERRWNQKRAAEAPHPLVVTPA